MAYGLLFGLYSYSRSLQSNQSIHHHNFHNTQSRYIIIISYSLVPPVSGSCQRLSPPPHSGRGSASQPSFACWRLLIVNCDSSSQKLVTSLHNTISLLCFRSLRRLLEWNCLLACSQLCLLNSFFSFFCCLCLYFINNCKWAEEFVKCCALTQLRNQTRN